MKASILIVALIALAACGNAEIIAPAPLTIVDSFPGQGALVAPGVVPIVMVFSEAVDRVTLETSVAFEQTTPTGTSIRTIAITLDAYDVDTFTATFDTDDLPPDATFMITLDAAVVRAESGARLPARVTRRFRTAR